MSELSPAAQAVRDNYGRALFTKQYSVSGRIEIAIAAALRAAADQVVIKLAGLGQESAWYLEEIATELEAQ